MDSSLWLLIAVAVVAALVVVLFVANTRRAKINRGKPTSRETPGEPFNRERPFTDSGDTERRDSRP